MNILALLGDPKFWGALVTTLLAWFLSSQSGRQIIAAVVEGVITAAERRHPDWQDNTVRGLAKEAVQLAFQVGGLAAGNDQKKADALDYLKRETARYGIPFDEAKLSDVIDLVWGQLKGQILQQHAEAAAAKIQLAQTTAAATAAGLQVAASPKTEQEPDATAVTEAGDAGDVGEAGVDPSLLNTAALAAISITGPASTTTGTPATASVNGAVVS